MIQVFNSISRQPAQRQQIDNTDGTLPYGEDNSFPLRLAELVQKSPTASAAISILADFIEGSGFSDATLKDKIINGRGEKFGMLHSQTCESLALFRGFVWLIKYTVAADISEIFCIPFENVRLGRPDDSGLISKFYVNPYYGTAIYNRKDTKCYDAFTDKENVLKQIAKEGTKFKGQILYFGTTRPLSRFYPEPDYYSAKSWMAIDSGISEYHETNLDAGFFQTTLLKMVGNPDTPSTHPDDNPTDADGEPKWNGTTRAGRFQIEMQSMLGADSKTKMMVLWAELKDQFPELQAFPSITNDNFFTNLQETCDRKILIAMKIPGILVNMGRDNSLSDGTQMANATRVMHDRVAKPQNMLESVYGNILPRFKEPYTSPVKIINTNSFQELDEIDPLIWEVLTPEEKRKWIKENTEYPVSDAPAPVVAPVNSFQNILFKDFPEAAKNNAKRALKFMETNSCGTAMGRRVSQDIVDGKPLAFKDLKRIYNYLKRNRGYENKLFSESCEAVLFAAWGGMAMFDYCASKITMINE